MGSCPSIWLLLPRLGSKKKPGRVLKDYIGKAPKDSLRWEVAGRFHIAARHPAQAEDALRNATELAPGDPRPAYELAQFYIAYNKAAAEAALRTVLERDHTYEAAHTSLGILFGDAGQDGGGERPVSPGSGTRIVELRCWQTTSAASLVDQGTGLDEALRYGQTCSGGGSQRARDSGYGRLDLFQRRVPWKRPIRC